MSCSRTRGKKGDEHFDPLDRPRHHANPRRGRGTYANDRPPVLGVVGRETGQIRLRVVDNTRSLTLCAFVEPFTQLDALVYTDEYQSYNALKRVRETVCHSLREWGVTTMAMAGVKSIPIVTKACGRDCVIFCVLFAVSTSATCLNMSLFTSFMSISRRFHRLLSLPLSIGTRFEHEPILKLSNAF